MFEKKRLAHSGVLSAPSPLKQGINYTKLGELVNTSINSIVTLTTG